MPKLTANTLEQRLATAKETEAAKKNAEQAAEQSLMAGVMAYIEENEIYYVSTDDRFYRLDDNTKEWSCLTQRGLQTSDDRLRNPKAWNMFLTQLQRHGHMKEKKTYTFNEVHDNYLNMLRSDGFLQPNKDVEPSEFFDVLMRGLIGSSKRKALGVVVFAKGFSNSIRSQAS